MYRKRATLLTINSLTAFTKVRRSLNSLDSAKAFVFLRSLSTAAERSYFQNPNGSNGENSTEYHRSGFAVGNQIHSEFQHNTSDYNQERRYSGNTGQFQQIPDEFYGGKSSVGVQRSHGTEIQVEPNVKFHGSYSNEGNRNEFQGNPIEQNGSNYSGSYGEPQQNSIGQNGNFRGNCGGNSEQLQHTNPYGGYGHSGPSQGSASDHHPGNAGVAQQKPTNYSSGNTAMTQQSHGNNYAGTTNMSQRYRDNYNRSDGEINNRILSGRGDYSDASVSQQNPNSYYMGNTGMAQHGKGGHYAGSDGKYQQSTNGYHGVCVGTPNGYAMHNQYPNGPPIESQSGLMDSQEMYNTNACQGSVEAAESSQDSGTIEELDVLSKEGKLKEVVELLGSLERRHIPVDLPRYLMLMKACRDSKALQEAKYVHEHLMRSVAKLEVSTYNQILEMYGRCCSMVDAFTVFDRMPQRNLTSWDTMITWLAKNGLGEDAIVLFSQFKEAGLKPDGEMFIGVFAACSVIGDITEGMLHFESMIKDYGIVPSMKHYVSIVDMLGSTGYLDEALEFVERMPVKPSVDVWEALMNLSRVYGHTELGDRCAELVELMDPSRLNEQSKAGLIPINDSELAKEKENKKSENLLAVRSRVHEYRAGDKSHPETDKIYAQLRGMKEQMKEAGYVAETRFVLHDIEQENKEEALLAHSERLAVAFGLMSSPARGTIRIIKNLRVCGDCHSALKIISKLVGRELVIRDAKRFHHFKDGLCSCRDYW